MQHGAENGTIYCNTSDPIVFWYLPVFIYLFIKLLLLQITCYQITITAREKCYDTLRDTPQSSVTSESASFNDYCLSNHALPANTKPYI